MTFGLFLAVGTFLMAAVMLLANRHYHIPIYKVLIASVLLTASGYAGAKLMAFIESGDWGGRSFYGALFFAPVPMLLAALLLRIRYADLIDICAPAECVMLALLKVKCEIDGCCYGMVLRISHVGRAVRFPSQIVECAVAVLIMLALLWMLRSGRFAGTLYPWYMIIYGVLRFALNLLRETTPFIWILPAGNFWSLISVAVGVIALLCIRRRRRVQ